MSSREAPSSAVREPVPVFLQPAAILGGVACSLLGYLGGMALTALSMVRALVRPRGEPSPFFATVLRHVDRLIVHGLPMIAIVHVGLGSFLAMQAYFGATFSDATGPVVGVGLVRNVAPLMACFVLSGLSAAIHVPELRRRPRVGLDDDGRRPPDRDVAAGRAVDPRPDDDPALLAATRTVACVLVGPFYGVFGAFVGIAVGWLVSIRLLGINSSTYFDMLREMLWSRDVLGVVVKGALFGFAAGWTACHEGLGSGGREARDVIGAATRACCLAGAMILLINAAWFLLAYHAGPVFGPTILSPPSL